jgi:hypothetical protein
MLWIDPIATVAAFALQAAPAARPAPAEAKPVAAPPAVAPSVEPGSERPAEPAPPQAPSAMPPVPATPGAPTEIVACQPFTLRTPQVHRCRREGSEFRSGFLVVLRAPAAYVVARQVAEPVAVFGSQTGERLWSSPATGLAVYVVPSWEEGAEGARRAGSPMTDPVFFASPELPERVDAAWIAAERARAEAVLVAAPARPATAPRPALELENVDNLIREAERLLPRDPELPLNPPRNVP